VTAESGPKVAYVVLWLPEPSQTFVLDEVNTLSQLGLDVEVFTLYGPRPQRRVAGMPAVLPPVTRFGSRSLLRLFQELLHLRTRYGPAGEKFLASVVLRRWRGLETAGEALWAALAGVHLARLFQERGVRHIHASWADGPATAAWVASRLSGIPFSFCGRARDIYPPDGALLEKMAAADFIRTDSQINQRYLAGLLPGAAPKIHAIYNGVPLTVNHTARPPVSPPFAILALGRLVVKKGFAVLLEACRLLAENGLDFQLTLAGDGPEKAHLQALVQSCHLGSQVKMPGFVNRQQVSDLFAASHVFVMPSIVTPSGDRDGVPTVIAEALLHQVPVVATQVCGIPEMVRPGETGWLVPPEDSRALAQAISQALADPAEAFRRAQNGARLMRQQFDSRKNYRRLMECFRSPADCRQGLMTDEVTD
jgi:glycosyltransferase involved in cell wall biosynthesis